MNYHRIPLGPIQTNCYVVANEKKECLVFDPGAQGKQLVEFLEKQTYKPLAILLTHAHFDHIGGVDEVMNHYPIPLYVHKNEKEWLHNSDLNGSKFFDLGEITAPDATDIISVEGNLTIGSFQFEVYETPGHSPGSVSYYFKLGNFVVSGDALFAGGIGRTDLPGGNQAQLLESIESKLLSLPEDTLVLSGHGPETTVGHEMDQNPFLNGF
ncbi:MBL fold metallo-hydrolase [Priestia megaterium]|uniref:MBL fold metallo-hydrolase n=1 Tax=Priestia megaterium TaxID=1404 RepID=UPI00077D75FD|nr:MBL fold metallo-hydrolase [Priestia megaterium]